MVLMDDNTDGRQPAAATQTWRALRCPRAPWSSRRLIQQWFGILSRPTLILLDPEGRIVSLNQQYDGRHPLRGPALLKTLRSTVSGSRFF